MDNSKRLTKLVFENTIHLWYRLNIPNNPFRTCSGIVLITILSCVTVNYSKYFKYTVFNQPNLP